MPRKPRSDRADAAAGPTFTNPILPGFRPDPSICRVGDDFYLVTSSFEYFPGVPIFHSRDLVNWRQLGHVLTRRSQLELAGVPSSSGIFAPTIRHDGTRFYVITTNVGGGGNFYVTATAPEGPWSDPVWLDKEGFDPSLLFAGGQAYYLRDGRGDDDDHPRVYQATLDLAAGKLTEPLRAIWAGLGGVWPEGAHVYETRGQYYLFASEGGTFYEHAEVVARGPSPFGPFDPGPANPILTHRDRPDHLIQAAGHADLVQLADGTTWMVALGIRPQGGRHHHLGRETFLAPVSWTEDGWPVVGDPARPGTLELRALAPALPPHPFEPPPAREDFDGPELAPIWWFVRNPDPADLSLSARPGFLRLVGSPVTLDDVASPALVVRPQQHLRARCRATLDFTPRHPNEEAGLTVRANERFRYDLVVRLAGAGREAVLSSRIAGATRVVRRVPIGDGPVELRVTATEKTYRFGVEAAGKPWALGTLPTQPLSAEEIGKDGKNYFTGTCLGLFATGNGQRSTAPADFDWFEYV